jgi:DNA-binding response OmpR family regulator
MKKRVLVADDEPMTAELLAYMLDHRGFEVFSAYDGREALDRIREIRPDAVVLDVMMPSLHGSEVARAVRSDPELQHVPVVLFSSVDESDVEWRDSGADVFLQKPIDICALPELLQNLIDGVPPNPPMIRRAG